MSFFMVPSERISRIVVRDRNMPSNSRHNSQKPDQYGPYFLRRHSTLGSRIRGLPSQGYGQQGQPDQRQDTSDDRDGALGVAQFFSAMLADVRLAAASLPLQGNEQQTKPSSYRTKYRRADKTTQNTAQRPELHAAQRAYGPTQDCRAAADFAGAACEGVVSCDQF
jgi:hypothetical protein